MSRPILVLVLVALILPVATAFADTITVNGDSSDWYAELLTPTGSIHKTYDTYDPGEEPNVPGYNIEYNWSYWENGALNPPTSTYNLWFGMEFEGFFGGSYPKVTANDFTYLLFDTDTSAGGLLAGWSGVDYYAFWNADATTPTTVALWKYDPLNPLANAQGYILTGKRMAIAANTGASPSKWFIEAGMDSDWMFGAGNDVPGDGSWGWAAYYDNGNSPADDACPGIGKWDKLPEPGTFAMFGLGLFSLVAIRRRKAA